jgi:hypothetical protein
MQGSAIARKNVALCSKDVNSTTGLDCLSDGGEDWIRTRGCVSPEDRALWPTKCVFRLSEANGESTPKNRADCTVQDRVGANQRLVFFLRYASPNAMFLDGSLGARDCGLSEVGFLLSHEPQLATPANLAQEIWTHNERREQ